MKSIKNALLRALLTVIYCALGVAVALPISYFFQSDIYHEMTLAEYIQGGMSSVMVGARFGSLNVYRYTAVACVLSAVVLGNLVERWLARHKTIQN